MAKLLDARTLPADHLIQADVCIVGAGPAGLSLAHELVDSGLQVVLLESGGLRPSGGPPTLPTGVLTREMTFRSVVESRARAFGGLANYWDTRLDTQEQANRSGPLDPIDLEARDWLPMSGWPFDHAHLEPYYRRAQALGGYGPYDYRIERWESAPAAERLPVDAARWETTCWMFGPTRAITEELREAVQRASNITPYVHANVVELVVADGGRRVERARVRRPDGTDVWVAASRFALATGGIENARLLLLSRAYFPAGIGNANDLVGRYLMEHQFVHGGELVPDDPTLVDRLALYDERRVGDGLVMGKLQPTPELLERERLLNISAAFVPKHRLHRRARQQPVNALASLIRAGAKLRLPPQPISELRAVLGGLDAIAIAALRKGSGGRVFRYASEGPQILDGGGWSALPDKPQRFQLLDVILHTEQAPHSDNRVTLSTDRDELGTLRPQVQWEWRPIDVDSTHRANVLLAQELRRAGIGTYRIADEDGVPKLGNSGLHHPMGTTRMHDDPRSGVVDVNGCVHGVANLFLTGCSVFPTGGYINPTLPIMALAVRLADHLRASRAGDRPVLVHATATRGAA